jgi:hypothetical protein
VCSYSRTSQHFTEPQGLLPSSQEASTCSYPEPYHSSPLHPFLISLRAILILSTHLRLGLPSGLFPSGFPTNILYVFLLSPIRATFTAYLILLDSIILTILSEYYPPTYVLVFPVVSFLLVFQSISYNILYAFLFSTIRATFPAHLILLDLIILIRLGEEYKL